MRIPTVLFLFTCGAAVSMPTTGSTQSLVPPAWKRLAAAPSPHSAEYACAGRTDTSWHVQFVNGQLQAKGVETYVPRRDALPYAIDLAGVIGTPPPAPGRDLAQQHDWALTYARDHAERRVVRTRDGWLVGFNGGEFGGSLWWYPAAPGPGTRLSDRNVRGLIDGPTGQTFVALVGFSPAGMGEGAALTVESDASAVWHVSRQVDLRGAPYAYVRDAADLLVATQASVERLSQSGESRVLSDATYGSMTPSSIAVGPNGEIAVGLRFFVDVLVPGESQYGHQWFVPTKCTRFNDRGLFGCVCTGPA
jgi:hypothetical protein